MDEASLPVVICEIEGVRNFVLEARRRGEKVGLVPTMGAFHEGHLSLVRAAKKENDVVIVSIFVNPMQFSPGEDLESYPRDLESDLAQLTDLAVEAVFTPPDEVMYPSGSVLTCVEPQSISNNLCGLSRPGHFRGVCTVVSKLFNIIPADSAYFGRKDAQQAAIIQQMTYDLDFPIHIVVCPIVREPDGLALSSRNYYLNEEERIQAVALFRSLKYARDMIDKGERDCRPIIEGMREFFDSLDLVEPEYVSIVNPRSIDDLDRISSTALVAVAAQVGKARLIDNMLVDVKSGTFEL